LGYHKNFLGSIATTMLLTLLAAGDHFRLPQRFLKVCGVVVALGLAASQSRAAMLALLLGTVVWLCRVDTERRQRYWKPFLGLGVLFAVVAGLSLSEQVDRQAPTSHDSLTQRIGGETRILALWQEHPVTGVGIRFFALPEFAGFQPPNNLINEILAEAGFPGLFGFLVFVVGSVWALWRCQGNLAIAGVCVVAARFAHGLVDIYWVGGTSTLPWLIAGMGLAAAGAAPLARPGRHRAVPEAVP
jgi:O-antigen ligase